MSHSNKNNQGTILDPTLIDYLSHIKGHKKKFIQFSLRKIEEIITTELELDLSNCGEITRRVTVQCFAYFLKAWPQWTEYTKNTMTLVQGYRSLKAFMRRKLMQTRLKEKAFSVDFKYNATELPEYSFPELPANVNVELPYNLSITAPAALLPDLTFSLTQEGDMEVEFKFPSYPPTKFTAKCFLEYPFVSVELNLPGIIKIERSSHTIIERFIQKATIPIETSSSTETTVENVEPGAKVYTFNFFKNFFTEFSAIFEKLDQQTRCLNELRSELLAFSNSFLTDIFDSDLCNKTVCEGARVTYNHRNARYYYDSEISQSASGSDKLVYRKVITPLVSYCLVSCSIKQEHVQKEGLSCFAFRRNKDAAAEYSLMQNIQNCLTYSCLVCKRSFSSNDMKCHLVAVHPLDAMVTCCKCFKVIQIVTLLRTRWRHECTNE